jgi:glyoxylase-like metal-dependent hydrolase (beta-lactamase superfamily II)
MGAVTNLISTRHRICGIVMMLVIAGASAPAQQRPQPASAPRLYVFDCGDIKGLDPAVFRFKKEELAETDFVVTCYLIAHPRGTLMWDVGVIPDSAFKADGAPVTAGRSTATKPLKTQRAAAGYKVSDITYLAMSHYHSDHTANANDFSGATWIVQQAERDAMFAEKPAGIIQPAHDNTLKDSKTIILENWDHRFPTFEFNVEQSAASRAKMDDFIEQTGARMWIEHDKPTHAKLKKAPEYYD